MQSYRLVIGSDGKVDIPNGQPGRIVTVVLEGSPDPGLSASLRPISSMTPEEREQLKHEFLERGRRVRARLKDQLPIDHGVVLYGEDGLPA
ncbi:MAG: hypothetical protein KF883_06480 [Thermomicrobiales bacterium]|nr:hypothetical protein [Thermomicrobiales bacterium]